MAQPQAAPGGMDRYGVIGWPLGHTLSPRIHALFAELTGQPVRYDALPLPPEDLARGLTDFFDAGGRGLNVTVPHKENVIGHCAVLTPRARQAGAVNTLAAVGDTLTGDNTDGAGLVRDLTTNHHVALAGARVLMIGAGGAARGAVGPLLDAGCHEIVVANRSVERARTLVADVGAARGAHASHRDERPDADERCGGALPMVALSLMDLTGEADRPSFDVIINATSAGLDGKLPSLPGSIADGAFCYDMLYGRNLTPFADWARAHGARGVATGFGMLVEQAAESFFLWRSVHPPTAPVYAALADR